ncbi:MAG: hypothetical protein ACLP7Q_04835 [Isosphaeraceae bacterium]
MDAFNPPRGRDAWAAIRGFVYQVDLTIRRWLDLAPDEALDLECGEDIDLVSAASVFGGNENERLLEQVKHRQEPITLVTGAAVCAIACAVEHRAANPQIRLRFRFTTNARVGKERFSRHPMPAIQVWEAIRTNGQATDPASLSVIRDILKSTTKPAKLHDDAWTVFRRLVEQGNDDELLNLICAFEWGTGTDEATYLATTLRQQLLDSGRARDLQHAQSLYERLFLHVFRTISRAGLKRVTSGDLIGLLALPTLSDEDRATLDRINSTLADPSFTYPNGSPGPGSRRGSLRYRRPCSRVQPSFPSGLMKEIWTHRLSRSKKSESQSSRSSRESPLGREGQEVACVGHLQFVGVDDESM